MPSFHYRAIQPDGKIAEGQLEAGGRVDAFRQMETKGLKPISLNERNGSAKHTAPPKPAAKPVAKEQAAPAPAAKVSLGGSKKVSARALENFTRLLSSL